MKHINISGLIIILLLTGCVNSDKGSANFAETIAARYAGTSPGKGEQALMSNNELFKPSALSFTVYDNHGNLKNLLYSNDNTIYTTCATWCPFSKALVSLLNDPKYLSVVSRFKFVFLFHEKEYGDLISQLNADNSMTIDQKSEYKRRLADLFKTQKVFDPSFLDNLPGEYYFFKSIDFNKRWDAYPCAYYSGADMFAANPIKLMKIKDRFANARLLDEMYTSYCAAEK